MSRKFLSMGRTVFSALIISLLSISSFSQVQLREALDFDGDTRTDYSIYRLSTGTWWVYGSSNNYILGQPWGNANDDRVVPGDYDGDNKADVAVFRDETGTWHLLYSSNFTYTGANWGIEGDEPVGRDYDGDGKTDFAIVRRSGGVMTWWIYKSTGGFVGSVWGAPTDIVAPGDYDGDGSFDLAVQRPGPTLSSNATFYILGTTAGFFGAQWGISSDFVVPGDYDGDGKTDIAIVREGENGADQLLWAILRSDGQGAFLYNWGRTDDDFTAQGYYDEDNRTDIAVWRQSTGTFYVLKSTDAQLIGVNWGAAGDIPIATYDTH